MAGECSRQAVRRPGRVGNLGTIPSPKRPKRPGPRTYTAADAARIICYAVGAGASPQEIVERAGCCLDESGQCAELRAVAERMLAAGEALLLPSLILVGLLPVLRLMGRLPLLGKRLLPLIAAGEVIDLAASEWRVIATEVKLVLGKGK